MVASTLDPSVYTAKVNQLVSDEGLRNTALGILTFLGQIVAALAQPIWGTLSDRSTSRWGRRKPFLVGGTLAILVLLTLIAFVDELWLLGGVILLLQVSANAVQGAYQGLIPDHVPPEQHGIAAGIKSLLEAPAVVLGPLVAGLFLGASQWPMTRRVLAAVIVLQSLYILATWMTLQYVQDPPRAPRLPRSPQVPTARLVWKTVHDTFRIDWRANGDLRWWLVNRFCFWFALLILRSFLINYVEQVIGLSPDTAQRTTGLLTAVLGILGFVILLPSGYIADRLGRRSMVMASGLVAAVGAFTLLAARSLPLMFGAGIFIGLGGGLFLTSSWALATELVPQEQAAHYLGLTNLATAGGSAAARLTGPLIDGLNRWSGSTTLGYVGVYALSGLLFLISSAAIRRVTPDAVRNPIAQQQRQI